MDSTWTNLKRRKLFQWGAAYLAMAWAFTEVLDLVVERFHWSEWLVQAVILLLAFGFLAVLTLAWFHGERGRQRMSGAEVLLLVAIGTAAALAVRGLPTPSAGSFPPGSEVAETLEPSPFGALTAAAGVDFLSGSGAIRVAVLPFRNLTPNPEDDAFLVEGLHDEALVAASRMLELDPVGNNTTLAAGRMLHFARRFDEAMAMFTRARSISPDDPSSPFYMALTYEALGRPRDALPGLQAMALVNGIDGSAVAELPGAFAEGGAAAVWRLWIEWRLSENPPRPGWVALGHARLGEAQEAVAWFRRGIPLHDSWLFQLNDPAMDPIRDDPRFHELLEELGLPVL